MNLKKMVLVLFVLLISPSIYSAPQYIDNSDYFVFKFNLDNDNLKLDLYSDTSGIAVSEVKSKVPRLVFAMNSALFDDTPVYKLVGLEVKTINRTSKVISSLVDPSTKTGNFSIHNQNVGGNGFLNNGVFFITIRDYKFQAHILKYEDFKKIFYTDSNAAIHLDGYDYKIMAAVQSSPMILVNNNNPNNKASSNKLRRSGIGYSSDGKTIIFISTKSDYNFYDLADLFSKYGASDALYLDGCTNSSLYIDKQKNLQITTGDSYAKCINAVPYNTKVAGTWVVTEK